MFLASKGQLLGVFWAPKVHMWVGGGMWTRKLRFWVKKLLFLADLRGHFWPFWGSKKSISRLFQSCFGVVWKVFGLFSDLKGLFLVVFLTPMVDKWPRNLRFSIKNLLSLADFRGYFWQFWGKKSRFLDKTSPYVFTYKKVYLTVWNFAVELFVTQFKIAKYNLHRRSLRVPGPLYIALPMLAINKIEEMRIKLTC